MKAVILAAGRGTRIRPLSETVPKPMIPIINKPVMEFLVDLLRQHGFNQIMISTAYLARDIERYFRDGDRFGVEIAYSFEGYHCEGRVVPEGLGAAGGLKKIQRSGFLDGTFAVLSGDALVDADLTKALAFHREKGAAVTMLLCNVPRNDVGRYGVVETDPAGRIVSFAEKPAPEVARSTLVNAGLYLFEPEALDLVPDDRPFDIAWDFFPLLVERQMPFYGLELPFSWIDIGRIPDYWRATQMVLNRELNFVEMSGREIAPGVWAGINLSADLNTIEVRPPVCIGSSTSIEPGASIIGPAVIGRNCVIEAGAHIQSSVVGDYTRISGFASLVDKIISGQFCVDTRGAAVDLAGAGYAFVVDDARERRHWTDDQLAVIEFLRSQAV